MPDYKDSTIAGNRPVAAGHSPVNPDLVSSMTIDIAVNGDGQIWVFHDKPFSGLLQWVEYYPDERRLVFVSEGGMMSDFGMEIDPALHPHLEKGGQIKTLLMRNGKAHDYAAVDLIKMASVN